MQTGVRLCVFGLHVSAYVFILLVRSYDIYIGELRLTTSVDHLDQPESSPRWENHQDGFSSNLLIFSQVRQFTHADAAPMIRSIRNFSRW